MSRLKSISFFFLLGLLFLPFLQERTGILPVGKLYGVENQQDSVALTAATWMDGSFQENFAFRQYRWMGFRPAMVRFRNQMDYWLYGETYRSVMVGKDGELFRRGSLNTWRGLDFVGQEKVDYHCRNTKILQDHMAGLGVRVLTVLTPTKLRCMPDGVSGYALDRDYTNNYNRYVESMTRQGVDFVDLTPILAERINTDEHRLFPRTGTHWTDYGAALSADLLIREMEKRSGQDYANVEITALQRSAEMVDTDDDAGRLLNLLFELPSAEVDYPTLSFVRDTATRKPLVITIGDSFWWKVFNQRIPHEVFASGSQYRYYNYEVFSDQWEDAKYIGDFDLKRTVETADWLILFVNEGNLHRFPFDFVDQTLRLYYQ